MAVNGSTQGGGKLSRAGERVLAALLLASSISEAATSSGISERTIYRWLARDDFQARYAAARRAVLDEAIKDLQGAAREAVAALRRNLTSGNAFAENQAAVAILSNAMRAVEIQELAERLSTLEKKLAEHERQKGKRR